MRIVLLKDVPRTGNRGEVKEVSDGYGRNFLIPKGFAREASKSVMREIEAMRTKAEAESERERTAALEMAKKLGEIELAATLRLGEKGESFGSVSEAKIRELLKEKGIDASKFEFDLPHGIKTLGVHEVAVKFPQGIEGAVKVSVSKEE